MTTSRSAKRRRARNPGMAFYCACGHHRDVHEGEGRCDASACRCALLRLPGAAQAPIPMEAARGR